MAYLNKFLITRYFTNQFMVRDPVGPSRYLRTAAIGRIQFNISDVLEECP